MSPTHPHGVRILTSVLSPRGSIPEGDLCLSRCCSGLHWTVRRFRPWFESRSGYSVEPPRVCRRHDCVRSSRARFDSSAGCYLGNPLPRVSQQGFVWTPRGGQSRSRRSRREVELRCGGSPGFATAMGSQAATTGVGFVSGVCGRHATVRRSRARFDSWRGHWFLTLKSRGVVVACKAISSGFESRRRLFESKLQVKVDLQRQPGHPRGLAASVPNMVYMTAHPGAPRRLVRSLSQKRGPWVRLPV